MAQNPQVHLLTVIINLSETLSQFFPYVDPLRNTHSPENQESLKLKKKRLPVRILSTTRIQTKSRVKLHSNVGELIQWESNTEKATLGSGHQCIQILLGKVFIEQFVNALLTSLFPKINHQLLRKVN